MSTRKVKLTGFGYWAKSFEDNRDLTGFENALVDIGGQTSIDLDIETVQLDKLKKSRSINFPTCIIESAARSLWCVINCPRRAS